MRASAGTGAPSGYGQYSDKPELSVGSFGNPCADKCSHSFSEGTMKNESLQELIETSVAIQVNPSVLANVEL